MNEFSASDTTSSQAKPLASAITHMGALLLVLMFWSSAEWVQCAEATINLVTMLHTFTWTLRFEASKPTWTDLHHITSQLF